MKLWSGRFTKDVDSQTNDFNSSIRFDKRLYKEDITGSIAHATMLGQCGIIPKEESELICRELKQILSDIENGTVELSVDAEDIHMNIETILTQRIGDAGKRLHTARSRNDQVAVDIRLYMRQATDEILHLTAALIQAIVDKAEQCKDFVMPAYTHLQRAQPVTFAHYILAYAQMLKRDCGRLSDCKKRLNECPLGAGALATTTYPIDRQLTADLLGFDRPCENSIDAVSDRDFLIEFASCASILMMHLSRFSEEMILWCSSEFGFIGLDDAFSTGSSIMPQKKNPDISELVRGKTGRVYGTLITLLTLMKGLPLAYNKDMQEDKECIFDTVDTLSACLRIFVPMFQSITVRKQALRNAASKGFINATDCADYLTKKGIPFRDAYRVIGGIVRYCEEQNKTLETLSLEEYRQHSDLFEQDIYESVNLENCVKGRRAIGGPAPEAVERQIQTLKEFLKECESNDAN
mgnify:FL=1